MKKWFWTNLMGLSLIAVLYIAPNSAAIQLPTVAPPLIDEVTDFVSWLPWDPETFEKARQENKPILASIEARWQYESEYLRLIAYQNRELADLINTGFIPIRVDSDQRPDIARRYTPETLPSVVALGPAGMPLWDPATRKVYGGVISTSAELRTLCNEIVARAKRGPLATLESPPPEPPRLKAAQAEVFKDDFVRIILRNIGTRYDAQFGGYGDPEKGYVPKKAELNTLRLLLAASQLWQDQQLEEQLTRSLKGMVSGNYYEQGFGEQADTRNWNRLRNERTLRTNMGLLSVYLKAYQAKNDNYFMEIAYKTLDDTVDFQDIFLRKGFSGAFYSAQRAMVPEDLARGLTQGPMIQSLITPWACEAIESYLWASQMTNDRRWQQLALKALDFLVTEMVRSDGRVAYSLDRTAPGVDTLFAAQPALASALLKGFQRTSDRRYLELAAKLMQVAHEAYWQQPGYFGDVAKDDTAMGLLRQPQFDLDANAQAVEVLLELSAFTGTDEYKDWAKQVLTTLGGEAQQGANESAGFALAVLKYIHSPVQAVVVGRKSDTLTGALRDACLALHHPYVLVEVVDPDSDSKRLAMLNLSVAAQPQAFLSIDLVSLPPTSDPQEVPRILDELRKRAQR